MSGPEVMTGRTKRRSAVQVRLGARFTEVEGAKRILFPQEFAKSWMRR